MTRSAMSAIGLLPERTMPRRCSALMTSPYRAIKLRVGPGVAILRRYSSWLEVALMWRRAPRAALWGNRWGICDPSGGAGTLRSVGFTGRFGMGPPGLEPGTYRLCVGSSNQLSYGPDTRSD